MPNDQLNECTDIIISGIEAFSAPTLNLEVI
jgi:hypothetical protein